MEEQNNTGKIVGALLLGAVIGGAIGILFAPAKGSVTRKKIMGISDNLSEVMKEKLNMETKKDLNFKILQITMRIKKQFPELSKYIEEMQETMPDEKHPKITVENLKTYHDSLNEMVNKYM
jgi:gas vesicle protein